MQAISYSLALDGQIFDAVRMLDEFEVMLDSTIAWQKEMKERCRFLRELLGKDPACAESQLLNWERDSIVNLKIEPG